MSGAASSSSLRCAVHLPLSTRDLQRLADDPAPHAVGDHVDLAGGQPREVVQDLVEGVLGELRALGVAQIARHLPGRRPAEEERQAGKVEVVRELGGAHRRLGEAHVVAVHVDQDRLRGRFRQSLGHLRARLVGLEGVHRLQREVPRRIGLELEPPDARQLEAPRRVSARDGDERAAVAQRRDHGVVEAGGRALAGSAAIGGKVGGHLDDIVSGGVGLPDRSSCRRWRRGGRGRSRRIRYGRRRAPLGCDALGGRRLGARRLLPQLVALDLEQDIQQGGLALAELPWLPPPPQPPAWRRGPRRSDAAGAAGAFPTPRKSSAALARQGAGRLRSAAGWPLATPAAMPAQTPMAASVSKIRVSMMRSPPQGLLNGARG